MLNSNQLTGSVPLYFENLPLRVLYVCDNNMSGQFAKSKNSSGYSSIGCIANSFGKTNNSVCH